MPAYWTLLAIAAALAVFVVISIKWPLDDEPSDSWNDR